MESGLLMVRAEVGGGQVRGQVQGRVLSPALTKRKQARESCRDGAHQLQHGVRLRERQAPERRHGPHDGYCNPAAPVCQKCQMHPLVQALLGFYTMQQLAATPEGTTMPCMR